MCSEGAWDQEELVEPRPELDDGGPGRRREEVLAFVRSWRRPDMPLNDMEQREVEVFANFPYESLGEHLEPEELEEVLVRAQRCVQVVLDCSPLASSGSA